MDVFEKMFIYSSFMWFLKSTFKHFLHDFIKMYVYAFYSLIALKKNSILQNPGSTPDFPQYQHIVRLLYFIRLWEATTRQKISKNEMNKIISAVALRHNIMALVQMY